MDKHSREQYLNTLREEYRRGDKSTKTRLLNEACMRTRLNRKVLVRKLSRIPAAATNGQRRRRAARYGAEVKAPLIQIWEIFEFPCGQRLAPIVRQQLERLRKRGAILCSDETAARLVEMSPKTMDRLLAREREVRSLKKNRRPPVHPLLYQRVPMKHSNEWDREEVGNMQLDYVLHCGRSTAGDYILTLSATDIATGWWEGCPQMGRSQKATQDSLETIRGRLPFRLREVHPDNDSGILNNLLWSYCRSRRIAMSRSRPYCSNDNAWVEQRNRTHVREVAGHRRFSTNEQLQILRELFAAVADFRNFFQPSMKLKEKIRVKGKVRRVYHPAMTPCQRVLELGNLKPSARRLLQQRYQALEPVELHQRIESLRNKLFDSLEGQLEPAPARRHGPPPNLRRDNHNRKR